MQNSLLKELSVKSLSIKNNNNTSASLYDINDNESPNHQFKENFNLNKKIIQLFIGNHPLVPMKYIRENAYYNFISKYLKNELYYNSIIINHIIHNDPGHIVAEFKDFLIMGDYNEFFQSYYKLKESRYLLPKIYDYYISSSVIFPNYVILPENQYIYKNIQRKQRVIDEQQEQEDKEEKLKNKKVLNKEEELEDSEKNVFNTQVFDSILNQTNTSGIKQFFGLNTEESSLAEQLSNIIEGINYYEKNKKSNIKIKLRYNYLYKNKYNMNLNDSETKINKEQKINGLNNKIINVQKNIKTLSKVKNYKDKILKKKNADNISKNKTLNKKFNYFIERNVGAQLSKSIKIIKENSLNNNNDTNFISLKNILTKNKNYNKSRNNYMNKDNKKKGRNILLNFNQDNNLNFFTSNNSNSAKFNALNNNNSLNNKNKCQTSRQLSNKKNINEILNKSKKGNSKIKKRNLYIKENNDYDPKSLHIIKKSLIKTLLNSTKDIGIRNRSLKNTNTRSILNSNKKINFKKSINATVFDSITKNSLNTSKTSNKNYKKIMIKNVNENINNHKNNVSEYYYFKNKHYLYTGFANNDIIYKKKINNDISSSNNKNHLLKNTCIKNIKLGCRTKNNSTNNILRYNNNLSSSNSSKFNKKKNIEIKKILNKTNENKISKDSRRSSMHKKNKISNSYINDKDNNLIINKECLNRYFFSNLNSNENNEIISLNKSKDKIDDIRIKEYKKEKINKNINDIKGKNNYKNNNNKENYSKLINLEKIIKKKFSDKNLESTYLLNSPKYSKSIKRYFMKSDIREKIIEDDNKKPLTVRETLRRNESNKEEIEYLTNKINEIKQYIKETDKKEINVISHIFKRKKINKKNLTSTQNLKKKNDNIVNNMTKNDKTRNKIKENKINNTMNNIDNRKIIKNIYVNNNLVNRIKKNNGSKNIKLNEENNNEIHIKTKKNKNNENKIKHYRYNSNCIINNEINNFSDINYNIIISNEQKKFTKKKIKELEPSNTNINYNIDNINKSGKNIILLNNNIKSCSLKILPINQVNNNKIIIKGININGFEKIITKKYKTRNIEVPNSVTDRVKKLNKTTANSKGFLTNSNRKNLKLTQNKLKMK